MYCSHGAKENKEMNRSAREAAAKGDIEKVRLRLFCAVNHAFKMPSAENFSFPQPLPSPVKKAARASPKPASKGKTKVKTVKPPSRARASARSGTRRRGLPLDVRRRIKVIAQNLPVTDVDDDDPIDFLR